MGQKIHPLGFRIGITENWRSRWFAGKQQFGRLLVQDQHIRKFIKKEFEFAGIPKIEIERDMERVHIFLYTSRPGVIIGRKGAKVDKLKEDLENVCGQEVKLEIHEVSAPELDAQLVAESVVQQLLKRAAFRRAMINEGVDPMGTRLIVGAAHGEEDVDYTVAAFDRALGALQDEGLL